MRQPRIPDERGNIVGVEGLFENLAPPGEVSAHDGMFRVCQMERAPLVLDVRAEKLGRQLVFELLKPSSVGITKKKADHAIGEYSVDESIDDGSDFFFPAQVVEEILRFRRIHGRFTIAQHYSDPRDGMPRIESR